MPAASRRWICERESGIGSGPFRWQIFLEMRFDAVLFNWEKGNRTPDTPPSGKWGAMWLSAGVVVCVGHCQRMGLGGGRLLCTGARLWMTVQPLKQDWTYPAPSRYSSRHSATLRIRLSDGYYFRLRSALFIILPLSGMAD